MEVQLQLFYSSIMMLRGLNDQAASNFDGGLFFVLCTQAARLWFHKYKIIFLLNLSFFEYIYKSYCSTISSPWCGGETQTLEFPDTPKLELFQQSRDYWLDIVIFKGQKCVYLRYNKGALSKKV